MVKHTKDNPPAQEDMDLEQSANFAAYESGTFTNSYCMNQTV